MKSLLSKIYPVITGIFFVLALPLSAPTQDLKKFEPPPVPPQVEAPGAPLEAPPVPALSHQDERVLVETLAGLIFIDRNEAVTPRDKTPPAPPDGVDISALPRLQTPEFRKILESYLGRPVSMAALDRLIKDIYAYYTAMDLPFVSVTLPEQDITSGVVQLLVIEGGLARLRIEGARWFSEDQYRSAIRLRSDEPIRLSTLNEDIAWINRNPFRKANIFFDQGEAVGGTNLVLRTQEKLPLRIYAGYNNYGNEFIDRNQISAGFNWGNAFGLGHQFSYQHTTSQDFKESRGHSGSYIIPLPWRDTLIISGTYSRIEPEMAAPFQREGMSGQASLRYESNLVSIGRLQHTAAMLFDYKVTDNNLIFGGIPVTDNRTEIMQLSGSYSGSITDFHGSSSFDIRLTASPGGLSSRNKTEYFNITRTFAEADYIYGMLDLTRTQYLPKEFSLMISGRLQLADGSLLGSEQLSIGGVNSVRGYNEGAIYGDRGYLVRAELLTPVILINRWLPFTALSMPLQILGFYDHGVTGNIHRLQGEDRRYTLKSTGLGFRFSLDRYVSINFDYGWRLAETSTIKDGSRGHFSITFSY